MDSINRLQSIWTGLARIPQHSPYVEEEDISSFIRRSGSEGPEYYARGFATLRTALLTGLETGWFGNSKERFEDPVPLPWYAFGPSIGRFRLKRGTVLPQFLHSAWSAVFFPENGYLRPDYDTGAVSSLNQLLAVFTKISGSHTQESERKVIDLFYEVEENLASTSVDEDMLIGRVKLGHILDVARRHVCRVLASEDPREILPKHGSGAAACGTPVRERYGVPRFVKSINSIWPMDEYYFLNSSHLCDVLQEWYSASDYVPCAKVLLVPKDARGPRLISCEPKETMWIQQGLMAKLYDAIESHPLTRGSVNFTDQRYNQQFAYLGSLNQETATLDLSEASDRVRLDVVQRLFPTNWGDALTAARSPCTQMPCGDVVMLTKHAPMGSACCFPVMAMVIWSVLKAALPSKTSTGLPTTILVYGDDIIIPSEFYDLGVSVLHAIHLKVNLKKSFVKGFFRESCGKEYINGVDITPVRLRAHPEDDVESRAQTIAFANNLAIRYGLEQYWMTELVHSWYREVAERRFSTTPRYTIVTDHDRVPLTWRACRAVLTRSTDDDTALSGVLNVRSPSNHHLRSRWNSSLNRREYRVLVPQPRHIKYATDAWCHLLHAVVNPRHASPLGLDALSKRVSYKYRWMALGV